jgi:hypothetical protein
MRMLVVNGEVFVQYQMFEHRHNAFYISRPFWLKSNMAKNKQKNIQSDHEKRLA